MRKAFFDGAHRTRHPGETWAALRPLLAVYGITRVADVTGLDDLGIPVTMAVRPLARTLSVAQGKGATLDAARVSGALEAVEAWHGERAVPAAVERAPAEALHLPYPVAALETHPGSLLTPRTVLDWITARSAVDGVTVPVPAACVQLGREAHGRWRLHLPSASTNGLASGNTTAEAVAHALYEVIERDAVSNLTSPAPDGRPQRIDPGSVTDPHCASLIERVQRAGAWLELWHLPSRFGVPVMSAYLWREDQAALLVSGSGAHLDPRIALSRAVTEAAQSRLTAITGSREDVHPATYREGGHQGPGGAAEPGVDWGPIASRYAAGFDTHEREVAHLAARVASVTGAAPLVVDLTHGPYETGGVFSVVKVVAPHLRYDSRHVIPRPRQGRTSARPSQEAAA
ncbi:YcaO-like family protein [Streptomyces sp. NPDC048341]|uniref:YcaO-like family protein n=1 Tax=Streptomyces sp. NPDC048341 TaxID=3154620 RepID=UPI00341A92DF